MIKNIKKRPLNKAGYTRRGPRIIRFDILARLHMLTIQASEKHGGKYFNIMLEMMALLGSTLEDLEGVLVAIGFSKQDVDLTPAELEIERQHVDFLCLKSESPMARAGRVKQGLPKSAPAAIEAAAIKVAAEKIDKNKTALVDPADTELAAAKKQQLKRAKRQREQPLNLYRAPLAHDADENIIYPTKRAQWSRAPKTRRPARRRPVAAEEMETSARRAPPRRNKLAAYGKVGAGKGKGRPAKPQKSWSSAPKAKPTAAQVADSPFAALAGLSFDKDAKPAKTAKAAKPKKKDQ